ncbi:DUF5133 domain-containing protein [Streptomyces canus]|uniref:DUF5133 domain-containing protein n=1 Tax=Streptomyces canus TaxID=58343 RepID=UPI002E355BDD|nr:DUF5133 domain-containing protein [Streptomyces canus]
MGGERTARLPGAVSRESCLPFEQQEAGPNGRIRRRAVLPRPNPSLLRDLVERCETLRRRLASGGDPEIRRRLEDASYTLCVGHRHPPAGYRAVRGSSAAGRCDATPPTSASRTCARPPEADGKQSVRTSI